MAKISELPPITGANTRTEDLFVIVNLVQGDDGTSNITRKELVEAIQYEIFSRITITGGTISGVTMFNSLIRNVVIDDSNIEDSFITRTDFNEGTLRNSDGDNLDIINSTFNEGTLDDNDQTNQRISDSSFTLGSITDSTAANVTITDSSYSDGVIFDVVANTMTITDSSFDDGTANNIVITNSEFNDGTGNNVVLTNSTIDDSTITDSTANNVSITQSTFTDGAIFDSTANNVTITQSVFDLGDVTNSNGDNLTIINSSFGDGTITTTDITSSNFSNGDIFDSNANNVTITQSLFTDGNITDSNANNVTITQSLFTDGNITDSNANNVTITQSLFTDGTITDSTANNVTITQSDFSDGTGNNNLFTSTTLDNSIIINSDFSDGTGNNNVFTNTTLDQSTIQNSIGLDLNISESKFDEGTLSQSTFSGGQIIDSELANFEMELEEIFDPNIDEESWFALKNVQTGETEKITYRQFFDEISKTVSQALKIHVDASSGRDEWPGSSLQPVKTLERACELALEKAGGVFDRNDVNNAVHISVGPGTYYTKGNLAIPDDCSATSTSGQYATVIEALPGYENSNCWLVGSGCYLQGFSYTNWKVDNFDYPEGGFAVAYRPGAKLRRSPYLRDSSQLSNFLRADVEPPLNPFNSKGTIADLGFEFILEVGHTGQFIEGDWIKFSSGAEAYISWDDSMDAALGLPGDLATLRKIRVRNLKNGQGYSIGDTVLSQSGGIGTIESIGIDDFPNREVGRGGGCFLGDRRVLDPDSLYTYCLCFGFTPRTQNGIGYVARDGAGVNGIGSLSIFTRCAFYALNGGQVTLNNSGSQFGDISMRAKGSTRVFQPKGMNEALLLKNEAFADTIQENANTIIDDVVDFLTANTADGGLGYTGYNAGKCERDAGIIIDGVGLDVQLNSNYWGRLAGITYRSPISYTVINDQLEPTIGANQYLQERIQNIFSTNSEIISRANTSFQELYNITEYGEEYDNGLILTPTGNTQMTAAAELIQDNKEFIQNEFIDWIDNNDLYFTYDSAKCRRDTEDYIIPAVYYDTLLDTNYNSITAGGAYYMSTAAKVIDKQKEETISAYKRLKDQINLVVENISPEATIKTDKSMDYIIDILANAGIKFSPTNATYDPITGYMMLKIGTHSLQVGQKILIAPNSITFTCLSDNNVVQISHPRVTDPIYNKPVYIEAVTGTTITVNVGNANGYTGVHTFVSAQENSISIVGEEITFSDNPAIDVSRRNARKQLQSNRGYIEDNLVGWINNNYYVYDQNKCKRDTSEYILPAVQRDLILGTNYNSVQAGKTYYTGIASKVINDQKVETSSAFSDLKSNVLALVSDTSKDRANTAFNEIIDILDNGLGNADTITWSDPASYRARYTPTFATYNPTNGQAVITLGNHSVAVGEYIEILPYGLTFTCSQDGDATEHSYPRIGDGNYLVPVVVTANTATSITCNVGVGAGGVHTFVSALEQSVSSRSYNSNGQYAREQLQANRSFLQEEVIAYLDANYFTFDGDKCSRDTGLILDAVRRDVATGSNYNSVFAGLAYRSGNASTEVVINEQLTETVAAITYVKLQIAQELSGASLTRSNAAFDEIIDILNNGTGNADPITFGTASVSANEGQAQATLQANKTFLQAEITAWLAINHPNLVYDQAKCERDVGYIVDSASWDIYNGSNAASINNARLYFDNAVAILPEDQRVPTSEAFKHLAYVAGEIVRNNSVVPSEGNAQSQTLTSDAGITVSGKVRSLIRIVSDAIESERFEFPAYVEPTTEAGFENAVRDIFGQTLRLQDDVIEYLQRDQNGLAYNESKCKRDIGLIVDAICKDVEYGGNESSIEAALYYFEARSSFDIADSTPIIEKFNILPPEQRAPTQAAFTHLASVASDIVQEISVTPTAGNLITQDTTGTPANAATGAIVSDLITIIVDNIGIGSPDNIPSIIEPNFDPNRTVARQAIQANKEFLTNEVINFINDKYFVYDDAKCSRDVGYLLDAVKRDVLTGSNFNSVFNGLSYRSGTLGTDKVVDFQLSETIAALEYVKTQAAAQITSVNAQARFNAGFDEIIDIMKNGQASADVISFGTQGLANNRLFAASNLQDNVEFLKKEMTAYLQDNYFTYDDAKCRRDVGLILDAVQIDLLTGSNFASVYAGQAYVNGAAAQTLANEKVQTIASFSRLKEEVANDINATAAIRTDAAFDEIIDIIDNGSGNADPLVFTDPGLVTERLYARQQLQANRAFIIQEITAWIAENLPEYDAVKCERDIGYIIDAVRRDLILGTNHNTITAGDAYLRSNSAYVLSDQSVYTIAGVEYARDQVKALANVTQDALIDTLFQRVIDVLNGTVTTYTVPSYPTTSGATYQDATRIAAVTAIRTNRSVIVSDVIAGIATFYPELEYDQAKCQRDVGYIIDAISHDVKYGGNSATIRAADAYFAGTVSQLGAEEVIPTIYAYTNLKSLINGYVTTQTEQDNVNDLIDIIINVIDAGTVAGLPVVVEPTLAGLTTTEHDDILANQSTIATNTPTYINTNYPVYDVAKCERDVGFIVDAISHDVQYGTNRGTRSTALMYFNNEETNVLPILQRSETNSAYERLASIMSDIVTETLITPSTGVILTQDTSGTPATATEAATVLELATAIANAVAAETPDNIPAAIEPDQSWVAADYQSASDLIVATKSTYQDYIVQEFLAINYSNEVCERDLNYVIDAVRRDLVINSNHHTATAANAFLRASYVDSALGREAELAVINFAREQIKALPNITSDATVDVLFNTITDVLDGSTTSIIPSVFNNTAGSTYETADRIAAATALVNNRSTILSDLTTWIQANRPEIYYDNAKCTRDMGYIIDAVRRDLILGGDYNTITAGNAYLRPTSGYPDNEQVEATLAAINYTRDLITQLPGVQSVGEIFDLFRTVTQCVDGTVTSIQFPTFPATPGATYQTDDRQQTVGLLQGAKENIVEQVIEYVAATYPALVYDQAKCERDTRFVIDGLCHDVLYGGNTASRLVADSYFEGTNILLGSSQEQTATADVYGQLKTFIGAYTSIVAAQIQTDIEALLDITIDAITAGSTAGIPAEIEIDTSGLDITEFDEMSNNQASVISDVVAWVNTNFPTYDVAKCERDAGFVIDAAAYDTKYGGNTASRLAAIAYFDGTVSQLGDAAEVAASIAAYTELKSLATAYVVTGVEQTRVEDSIDIVIDALVAGNTDSIPAAVEPTTTGLSIVEWDEILSNQATVITDSITFANETYPRSLGYNVAKCERDLGYLIDSVTWDIQHDSNTASINNAQIYFENATSVLPVGQRPATADAFNHIASVASLIAQDIAVTPTTGNPESQVFGITSGPAAGALVEDLFQIVANAITAGNLDSLPAADEPTQTPYDQEYIDAVAEIDAIKPELQAKVISFIQEEFNGLGYDQAKCERDTGYILDGISHDIQYAGNAATYINAQVYFENAINVLPTTQREPTQAAWTYLGDMLEKVVQRQEVSAHVLNTTKQDTSFVGGNPNIALEAKGLARMIADQAYESTSARLPERIDPDTSWQAPQYVIDKEAIEDASITLTNGIVTYIAENLNGLGYDELRCRRDVQFIVNGLSHDIQYGGNHATRINAQIYFENALSVLSLGTRRQTADAYEYLGELVRDIVQGVDTQTNAYTTTLQDFTNTPSNSTEGARVQNLVQIIEDTIRNDDVNTIPELVQPDFSWVDATTKQAADLMVEKTPELSQDLIDWIASEFTVLDYNRDKCRRDTFYILDAFSYDLNYGGNLATRWNTDFYYWNDTFRIPEDQREPTGQAYRQLGLICEQIVKGTYPGQVVKGEIATNIEGNKVRRFGQNLYEVLYFNDVKKLPLKQQPDTSWIDKIYIDARQTLSVFKTDLAFDVVRFVGATYGFVDIPLTRRDTYNLLQAIQNDFNYENYALGDQGGQNAVRTFTASLFDYNANIVFPVFNPPTSVADIGLVYKGSIDVVGALPDGSTLQPRKYRDAYIVASNFLTSDWAGDIYYWNGVAWVNVGPNNTELLEAFVGCWERIRDFIISNYSPNSDVSAMLTGLINDCLIDNVLKPQTLVFGALVESIAHQFNGASAGVNRNALPLNFRNLGTAISALASVLYEEGGRIRWSGSDELNNQYFARGLRINGRTGRIEGRPFTSSVRKLARRASQSRAFV